MIILNGDDLYMMLYNPDDELKALVKELAHSEGLFFTKRNAPDIVNSPL